MSATEDVRKRAVINNNSIDRLYHHGLENADTDIGEQGNMIDFSIKSIPGMYSVIMWSMIIVGWSFLSFRFEENLTI